MELWIWFTLLAASMQAGRNALQKQLSLNVPVLGVTLARFLFAVPLAMIYLLWHYQEQEQVHIPEFSTHFWVYVLAASVAQIIATTLMVQLFKLKNYAIGVGLAKSEAILAAIVGVIFFTTPMHLMGWLGVLIGSIAIFIMAGVEKLSQFSWQTLIVGLLSGLSFALTSLWVREASLLLDSDQLVSAAWVLFWVILTEAVLLSLYLLIFERDTWVKLLQNYKMAMMVSLFSFLGSLGWFSAMSLQHVAFVKTVGQIEIFFMLMISLFIFREKLKKEDILGLILIALAAILVVWA